MKGKIIKKHLNSIIVVVSAAVLVVIGSTLAFFNSTDATTNKFTGDRFNIQLLETKWDAEKAVGLLPGDEIDKNPQIKNLEHTKAYVFLRVTVPCDSQMADNDDGTPMGEIGSDIPLYKFMVAKGTDPETYDVDTSFSPKQTVNSAHWSLVTDGADDYTYHDETNKQYVYVYAYAENGSLTPMNQNDITETLFDRLQLWNFSEKNYDPDKSHSVKVEALGIQTELPGYTASDIFDIWKLVEEEAGG